MLDGDSDNSTPILLPGVDMLNHDVTTKVTWNTSQHTDEGTISVILEQAVESGLQVFNNYGPHSNEVFLLGYGFLPSKEQQLGDVVALKAATSPQTSSIVKPILQKLGLNHDLFFVGRDGVLPEPLLKRMRVTLIVDWTLQDQDEQGFDLPEFEDDEDSEFVGWDVEIEMMSMFQALLMRKLNNVENVPDRIEGLIRPEVEEMISQYRQGQRYILVKSIEWCKSQLSDVLERASADGFDTSEFDEEGEENE
ncbi:hypothetical protein OIO90_000612 [Microbotryomycetes sp. JL221]|nr:hypothetical protein OIO90_000612 [Microbotryomycetes sp. JL221]